MENYEKTIDLIHVFNYVKYNLKRIIVGTLAIAILAIALVFGKIIIMPSEDLYYSTAKLLFKFNSWSTTEKQYNFEDWNLVGAENLTNDSNNSFMSNSKSVFMSDAMIMSVMDRNNIHEEISDFKKKIIVSPIQGTDIVSITVMADSPELAQEILGDVLEDGLNIAKSVYELKYEVIDHYTNTDKAFAKISVTPEGNIETSSGVASNIKMIVLVSVGGFGLLVAYYVLKCIFNNKVESVELIEEGFNVPVLQVLGIGSTDYDITTTKLINSSAKTVLFTSIKKEEKIGEDIVSISKKLLERNKKTLIVCAGRNDSVDALGITNLDKGVNKVNDLHIVVSDANGIVKTLNEYQDEYDLILIESDYLENSSDALLMSKNIDFTVLIIECNSVSVDVFNRKVIDFKNYSTGINGVILKNVTKVSSSYKYI